MAVPVIMPKFEMSQESATLVEWLVAEGEPVHQGQPILEVETDKVTMQIEAPASGVLAQVSARRGDVVPVTRIIAYLLEPGESAVPAPTESALAAERAPTLAGPAEVTEMRATPVAQRLAAELRVDLAGVPGSGPGGRIVKADVEAAARQAPAGGETRLRATPAARRLAREAGIDLVNVAGSGPLGRIQAADIAAAATAAASAAAPAAAASPAGASGALEPFTGMRATIARRMTESYRQAPHIHLTRSVDVTEAEAARQRWAEGDSQRISLTVLLVKACAWALRRHPAVNATVETPRTSSGVLQADRTSSGVLQADRTSSGVLEAAGVRRWTEINIGVAVALPEGLIVPVLRQADAKSLVELAEELAALAEQAKAGTLRPDQVSGGTFTLTNLGMFGVESFDPILNPPQAAILGVGAVVESVVPLHGQIAIRPRMQLTLAADHRALDGAVAAQFLHDLCRAVEDPAIMLL